MSVVQAVRRRLPFVLGAPIVLILLTVAFVFVVRPVYEAASSLRVDQERSGPAMLEMLSSLSGGEGVFTEMAVLRSRSLAEDVVRTLALQVSVAEPTRTRRSELFSELRVDTTTPGGSFTLERTGPGRFRVSGDVVRKRDQPRPFERPRRESRTYGEAQIGQPLTAEGVTFTLAPAAEDHERIVLGVSSFQDAVRDLQAEIDVSLPDREADVVVIRHRGVDPEVVQAVPNMLAERFLARRQQSQSAAARGTAGFLEEQIDSLEGQLHGAEESLRAFREQNRMVSVEAEADAQVERLAGLQVRRDLFAAEREALGRMLTEVRAERPEPGDVSPYRKLMSFPTLIQNTATAEMLSQLVTLENQRGEFMMTRTADDRDIKILEERIAAIEEQLRMMAETYWRGLGQQVGTLEENLAGFQGELARIPAQQMTFVRLGRTATMLGELYTLLQTKQKEAQIAAAVQDQAVRVVDPARYPTDPIRPKPVLSLLIALALGVVLGVGGAVAAEHLDRTVRDRNELQAATGAIVLGLIPMISEGPHGSGRRLPWQTNGNGRSVRPRLVEQLASGDPASEAYRSLRTNLNFARPGSPPRTLVITSPMPGDGKSTTAANMALVRAQQGGRVLLVDADMRRGALHDVFGKASEPGLSNVLVGATRLEDALQRVVLSEGYAMDFLAGGLRPPNPAELVSSEAMGRLLAEAAERYDVVILDAPPLNMVTDAALLGTRADGVLLVARAGVTEAEPLAYAVDQIARVRAPLLGTVLNGVDERGQGYYGSGTNGARGYFDRA